MVIMTGTNFEDSMKKIMLHNGEYAIVDDTDFEYLNQWNWYLSSFGYVVRSQAISPKSKVTVYMHCVISPPLPNGITDHRSGDKLDNRKLNLRSASYAQNNMNRTKSTGTSSKFKGVCWDKEREKWVAYIKKDGKIKHLGRFDSEIEAAQAYDKTASVLFGQFAKINKIGENHEKSRT